MYKLIIFFFASLIACHALPKSDIASFNKYYVYNSQNERVPVEISINDIDAAKTVLSAGRNTSIIVHGHRGSATTSLSLVVKDAFLHIEGLDVIVVDWSVYASQSYPVAVAAVPSVGTGLANLISELVTAEVVALDTLHLVGFDLGAHVVGFTGRALGGIAARITGLSPAASNWGSSSSRLTKNDALYVEIIHTDAGGLLGNGINDAIGDVDIFVNGGSGQPGCFLNNMCSHNRAWEVFAATLTHSHLIANKCGNRHQVSLNLCRGPLLPIGNNDYNKLGDGLFRVNTRRTYPY